MQALEKCVGDLGLYRSNSKEMQTVIEENVRRRRTMSLWPLYAALYKGVPKVGRYRHR